MILIGMLVDTGLYPGAVRRTSRLHLGDPVILEHDGNAIRVLNIDGRILGHMDRCTSTILSINIDRGILYTAHICTQPVVKQKPNLVGVKKGSVLIKCIPIPPLMKSKERIEHEPN